MLDMLQGYWEQTIHLLFLVLSHTFPSCFEQDMNVYTVKRVFASARSIINPTMREHGIGETMPSVAPSFPTRVIHRHGELSQPRS